MFKLRVHGCAEVSTELDRSHSGPFLFSGSREDEHTKMAPGNPGISGHVPRSPGKTTGGAGRLLFRSP